MRVQRAIQIIPTFGAVQITPDNAEEVCHEFNLIRTFYPNGMVEFTSDEAYTGRRAAVHGDWVVSHGSSVSFLTDSGFKNSYTVLPDVDDLSELSAERAADVVQEVFYARPPIGRIIE